MTATDDTDLALLALAVRFPLLTEEELRLLAAMGGPVGDDKPSDSGRSRTGLWDCLSHSFAGI